MSPIPFLAMAAGVALGCGGATPSGFQGTTDPGDGGGGKDAQSGCTFVYVLSYMPENEDRAVPEPAQTGHTDHAFDAN